MTDGNRSPDRFPPENNTAAEPGSERRKEIRSPIDSIVLPFLGSVESNQATFEYLLFNLSPSGVGIMIPRWVVRREHLHPGDTVELHAPFRFQNRYFTRGKVAWTQWDESANAQACGIFMVEAPPPYYPVYISIKAAAVNIDLQDFESSDRLLCLLLKDAHLLKRGALIYLKHLIPFFYRLGEFHPAEYKDLKDHVLEDIQQRVSAHARALADCETAARKEKWGLSDLPRVLDLDLFRGAVESELQRDLLLTAFQADTARRYLDAIQELEKKLYHTFNTLIMLYMQALNEDASTEPASADGGY